jgi:protoheme IX farnesyltransferase
VNTATIDSIAQRPSTLRLVLSLFKLRIGFAISLTALAGLAISPGPGLPAWKVIVLALAVLVSSASAGAFNQYVEQDIDAQMKRTRRRAFVTGALPHTRVWLWIILAMVAGSVGAAWWALNPWTALYTFLGAFFYAVVYTVWLKRRTWMNIVIGGLSGSFAVLAGAAAADPVIAVAPLSLAFVLFLWTPPHFWSLAIAYRQDYAAVKVPMLPLVMGDARCAKVILSQTVLLVAASLVPLFFGLGAIYLAGAAIGGAWMLSTSWRLMRNPGPKAAMLNFHASLGQLTLLLVGALVSSLV